MPVCTNCGKQYGGNINTHQAGKACKEAAKVKAMASAENNNVWRIRVDANAEFASGGLVYVLESWFWDGCPVRATEMWHVLASGSSPEALVKLAEEEGLKADKKV